MKNKIILAILILSMIALIISGCGGGGSVTPPPPDEPIEPIIPETTKVAEEETIQEIAFVAEDQSTIIFEKSTPQLEELAVGDIIAMGVTEHTPEGLLRKVKKITKGGKDSSEVVIETEFATLEEAIEQGEFYFNEALKAEDAKEPVCYVKGVEFIRDKSTIRDSKIQLLEFTYNINAIIYDEDNNPNTEEDNIALIGQISFDYNLLLSGKIAFFHKLKELNFQNIVEIEKNLGVTVGGSVEIFSYEKELYTHSLGTKLVWVGYLPIVLSPKITISANVNGEIFAKVTAEITDKDTYTAGIKFDNGSWQPISKHENYPSPPSLSLSAGGAVTFGVGPKLECKVDGVIGPYCETSLYGKVIADIYTNPWWKIYAGIIAKAGVKIEIFSKVLASADLTVLDLKKIIAQADGPFINLNHPPVISDLTANPSSINTNQTTTITCTASDEDVGDTLIYTWNKSGGTFEGSTSGSTIIWRAPSTPGSYTVSCEVSDGEESDSKSVNIEVTPIAGSQYVIQWSTAESNGWANPLGEGKELITSTAYDYDSSIYLNNHPGKKHMGTDIISELDENVYTIASGTVVKITRDYSSTSNQSVVIIKHTNSNNKDFFAIYGHVLARDDLEENNSELEAGEKIGIIKKAGSPVHLHFGINRSSEITDFMFTNLDGVQWGWGRIPEFANPSDYGWVEPIDYLNNYLPLPALPGLTPEEVELIGKWGFGGDDIVRRWPDGDVNVYDETNYTRIQDVIQEWNTAIGGSVVFHLSNDPNSLIKVKFDPDISQDLAGQYFVYCSDDDYEFYRADVNIQKNYLDSLNSDTKYCLYLWLFSGAAGFNIQADVDPNPFGEWQNFDKIPDDVEKMLHGLYKVPCGYDLLDKKLKKNWSQTIIENLQNIYEGGLNKLCK